MADESNLNRDVDRAHRAKAIMEDPLMVEAFKALEQAYVEAWFSTEPADADLRERTYYAIKVLGNVHRHFEMMLEYCTLAQAEIDRMSKK